MAICKTCYRERDEKDMKRNAVGELSSQCLTCYEMIGKGAGYGLIHSDEEIEIWLDGLKDRKNKLIKEGKLQ